MTENLLVEVDHLQIGRDSFKSVGLVYLCVDVLQGLEFLLNVFGAAIFVLLLAEDVRL